MNQTKIELAAKLLKLSLEEVADNSDMIADRDLLYVSIPTKGGVSLLVGSDNNVLFADSSIGYTRHLQAYQEGQRTPLELFA